MHAFFSASIQFPLGDWCVYAVEVVVEKATEWIQQVLAHGMGTVVESAPWRPLMLMLMFTSPTPSQQVSAWIEGDVAEAFTQQVNKLPEDAIPRCFNYKFMFSLLTVSMRSGLLCRRPMPQFPVKHTHTHTHTCK